MNGRFFSASTFFMALMLSVVGSLTMSAQVTYNETSGDLPDYLNNTTYFTIAAGTNTWTGTIGPTAPPQQDAWWVVIPSGVRLDSVKWSGPASDGGSTYIGSFSMSGSTQNHAGAIAGYVQTGGSGTWSNITDPTLGVGVPGIDTMFCIISTDFATSARSWTVQVFASSTGGGGGVAPAVTVNPSSTSVCLGASASFTASASGTPAPTVQWQKKPSGGAFGDIGGATGTTYSFTPVAGDNGSQYRAVFTNATGSATSNAATLTVNQAPSITTHPVSQTVCVGYDLTLSAAATGTPAPSVQWQVSTNGGVSFSPVPGATNTTYVVPVDEDMNGYQYQALFTNSCGATPSASAAITVSPPATLNVTLAPKLFTTSSGVMRTVYASPVVSGGCSPVVTLESITSSDPDAGAFAGDQPNDIQNAAFGTNDTEFDLRAEVVPLQEGRIYSITYRVDDGTDWSRETVPVIVPSGIGILLPGGTNDCGAFIGSIPVMEGRSVTIPFTLTNPTTVRLTIYNMKGKAVYGLINEMPMAAGNHSVVWDGTNNAGLNPGTEQPDGAYLVLFEACNDYREVSVLFVDREEEIPE